jgi:hypothetical protein
MGNPVMGLPGAAPTPIFTAVEQYSSAGISNYNGLTAGVIQRSKHGLSFQFNFTWSHALDEVSNGGIGSTPYNNSQTFGSLTYQINPTCLKCNNYGNADYDVRKSLNGSYVWLMPFKFSGRFANAALSGWQVSQNFFRRSALPLSVIDGNTSITNYGPTNTVANVIAGDGQQSCVNGNSQCLNAAAFGAANLNATFPNQRRNQFRGPNFFDSDFTIGKNFKLTERLTFNFSTSTTFSITRILLTLTLISPMVPSARFRRRPRRQPARMGRSSRACLLDESSSSRARFSSRF